ncbi:MAG: hypothetical protein GWO11_06770 [Desulfuromonadales bacterium]|nr:hypothetical protein [Desulfuromonadales bacterium]NIS44103.1 hypothetical protein [Desulfuromonadales bacterium]
MHFWLLGSKKSEIGAKKERMLALDEQREKAQARLTEIDQRLEQAGLPVSSRELLQISETFARHREIELELRDIDSALKVLDSLEDLEQRRQEVLDRMSEQGGVAVPKDDALSGPESVAEAEERLEEFRRELGEKEKTLSELNRQKTSLVEDVRHLGKIEKDGERLKERETGIRQRLAVLATARELLCRIDGRHEGGEIEKLAEAVARHAGRLTSGRYRQVRIDSDGGILLQARGGQWQPLSCFGRATVDTVGIAVRMALIDTFFHGRSVPLLLDEPLVNLDHKRINETLKELEKMAASHQVILFSHQESLLKKAAKSGWNLITLNGKDGKQSSPDDERSKDDEQQLHLL